VDGDSGRRKIWLIYLTCDFAPSRACQIGGFYIFFKLSVKEIWTKQKEKKDKEKKNILPKQACDQIPWSCFDIAVPWICKSLAVFQMMSLLVCFLGPGSNLRRIADDSIQPCADTRTSDRAHLDRRAKLRRLQKTLVVPDFALVLYESRVFDLQSQAARPERYQGRHCIYMCTYMIPVLGSISPAICGCGLYTHTRAHARVLLQVDEKRLVLTAFSSFRVGGKAADESEAGKRCARTELTSLT
jgi:hypothetical protein